MYTDEIRLELIKIAKELVGEEFRAKRELVFAAYYKNLETANGTTPLKRIELPELDYPKADDILYIASKLASFVENKVM